MLHYYLGLALVLVPSLFATLVTGMRYDGSQTHLALGLFTAILCVATNTLLILFMIVTGRVLKAAMRSRPLGGEFLAELNQFFARRRAYPMALVGAAVATATAVLGYGPRIGVPVAVHLALGLTTVVVNLLIVPVALRTLRSNQALLDRVAGELDRIDRVAGPPDAAIGEPEWAFRHSTRWAIFAGSAWLPYLYWALVVWHGDFERVSDVFLAGTAAVSIGCVLVAWRRRDGPTGPRPRARRRPGGP